MLKRIKRPDLALYNKLHPKKNKKNGMFGRKHTKKAKKKMSFVKKGKYKGRKNSRYIDGRCLKKYYYCIEPKCNNEICMQTAIYGSEKCNHCARKNKNNGMFGKHQTKKSKKQMSLSSGGTGIPYEFNKYPLEFFRIRNKILKRDNYTCQKCNKYGNDVHHIDYNKENNQEDNLICLCRRCNIKVNCNRDYWFAYFMYIFESFKI